MMHKIIVEIIPMTSINVNASIDYFWFYYSKKRLSVITAV